MTVLTPRGVGQNSAYRSSRWRSSVYGRVACLWAAERSVRIGTEDALVGACLANGPRLLDVAQRDTGAPIGEGARHLVHRQLPSMLDGGHASKGAAPQGSSCGRDGTRRRRGK